MSEKEIQAQEVSVVGPAEDVGQPNAVWDLLCLFYTCIATYEWVHADSHGQEPTGIAAALRGSFALLIREECREMWEEIVDE